jgi:hypothetical protein
MIISFPTALYKSILPTENNPGNVTFTISSNDPPRPSITPYPLQVAEVVKPLPPKVYSPEERRVAMGDLIFSVSQGSLNLVSTGVKQFEVGQILDFTTESLPALNNLDVPDIIDLQQNTNRIDVAATGLTDNEIYNLELAARTQFNNLVAELNALKTGISDTQLAIQNNQRQLNENRKVRDAAILVTGSDPTIIEKLDKREADLLIQRDELAALSNVLTDDANKKYNELISLRELAR